MKYKRYGNSPSPMKNIPKLQAFAQTVGQNLGPECEWSWHDQVDIARAGNSKGKRPGAVGRRARIIHAGRYRLWR